MDDHILLQRLYDSAISMLLESYAESTTPRMAFQLGIVSLVNTSAVSTAKQMVAGIQDISEFDRKELSRVVDILIMLEYEGIDTKSVKTEVDAAQFMIDVQNYCYRKTLIHFNDKNETTFTFTKNTPEHLNVDEVTASKLQHSMWIN